MRPEWKQEMITENLGFPSSVDIYRRRGLCAEEIDAREKAEYAEPRKRR